MLIFNRSWIILLWKLCNSHCDHWPSWEPEAQNGTCSLGVAQGSQTRSPGTSAHLAAVVRLWCWWWWGGCRVEAAASPERNLLNGSGFRLLNRELLYLLAWELQRFFGWPTWSVASAAFQIVWVLELQARQLAGGCLVWSYRHCVGMHWLQMR